MKFKRFLFAFLLIIFLSVFLFSGCYVVNYLINSRKQSNMYNDLASIVENARKEAPTESPASAETVAADSPDELPEDPSAPTELTVLPEYQELYERNSHMVGWVKIEGTKINYPVMQVPDQKDYYLYRDFNKNYNGGGCIYAGEPYDVNAPSDSITIYGHHMRDGSMFANLDYYNKKSFWEEHGQITFDTLYEHHTYAIFAVFKTSASVDQGFRYHEMVDAADQEDFDAFISTCKELSFYDTGLTPEYGDKIICLSTCEYTLTNGRLVVAAMRID